MKRLLNKTTDTLADAALLERSVEVKTNTGAKAHEPLMAMLKRFFQNFSITMADAALLEMGVFPDRSAQKQGAVRETLEENLIEVAFAEAADYDDIHKAILWEHQVEREIAYPDDCQYGDNDMCFRHAA